MLAMANRDSEEIANRIEPNTSSQLDRPEIRLPTVDEMFKGPPALLGAFVSEDREGSVSMNDSLH